MAETEPKALQAYREIERMIVFQEVKPGTLISEAEMMTRTGLGRTPVREALQRLARNRMVEIHPNRGILVPAASIDEELRLLEVRRALEVLAVRLACVRATAGQRAAMRQLAEELKTSHYTLFEYADTVKRTHELVASGANNAHLADAIAPLQGLSRRFWIGHVKDEDGEIKRGSALHIAILEAIVEGDQAAAEAGSQALNDYLNAFAKASLGSA